MKLWQRRLYYWDGMDTVDIAELYDVPEYVIYNEEDEPMGRPPGARNKNNRTHYEKSKLKDEEPVFGESESIRKKNEESSKKYIDILQEMGYKLKS
jgi:hypothetical protein